MKTLAVFLAGLLLGATGLWFLLGERVSPEALRQDPLLPVPEATAGPVTQATFVPAPDAAEVAAPVSLAPEPALPVEPPSGADAVVPPANDAIAAPAAPGAEGEPASDAVVLPTSSLPAPSRKLDLLLPVQGVAAAQLSDTFTDARSEGRSHDAIDIMAPTGTPVLAVEDGRIVKFFDSVRGGLTIYQFDANDELAYYYAHLDRRAEGLGEGQAVKRGDVIGYVGYTGNASPDAPHLHFAIFVLGPEKNWWQGVAINPYPWLGGR